MSASYAGRSNIQNLTLEQDINEYLVLGDLTLEQDINGYLVLGDLTLEQDINKYLVLGEYSSLVEDK